jgi:hypothetical protein
VKQLVLMNTLLEGAPQVRCCWVCSPLLYVNLNTSLISLVIVQLAVQVWAAVVQSQVGDGMLAASPQAVNFLIYPIRGVCVGLPRFDCRVAGLNHDHFDRVRLLLARLWTGETPVSSLIALVSARACVLRVGPPFS